MRLESLEEDVATRLRPLTDATGWPHLGAVLLAENVIEDDWFDDAMLAAVAAEARVAAGDGCALLEALLRKRTLARLRALTADERPHVPDVGWTHFQGIGRTWEAADPDPDLGTLPGEGRPVARVGDRIRVRRRGGSPAWVTFPAPSTPDEVVCELGLAWAPGPVFRAEIAIGATAHIPTLFDGLYWPPTADWRARRSGEKRAEEPWGVTRRMDNGLPARPELIVEVLVVVEATFVGASVFNGAARPYLASIP